MTELERRELHDPDIVGSMRRAIDLQLALWDEIASIERLVGCDLEGIDGAIQELAIYCSSPGGAGMLVSECLYLTVWRLVNGQVNEPGRAGRRPSE